MAVSIRELKNRLSYYLDKVKKGEKLAVSKRGRIIAYITPAENSEYEGVISLIKERKASWSGEKPSGAKKKIKIVGKPVSKIVLKERR